MKKLLLTGFALVAIMAQAQNSWVAQATNFAANGGVKEICIVDANTAWITSYDGSGGGAYPRVYGKTTNGSTWSTGPITGTAANALISDIHGVDANNAWVVTAPYTGSTTANAIWKTSDGGATWAKQTSGYGSNASSFANHIYFWDANNGWTSGDPVAGKFEMYKTSNGGTTWTAVAGALAPQNANEFTYVGLKEVLGDNIWVGSSIGRVLHSPDRGVTWTGNFSPVLDFGGVITAGSSGSFAFSSPTNGLLIAVDSGPVAALYSTSDGGVTWDPVTPTGTWYFGDVAYVPGTANTYVTTGINFNDTSWLGSAYSTDGGQTWTSIDAGEQRGEVKFLNPTTGYAGQFSDGPAGTTGIMKFSGNLNLATSETGVKSNLKVYPNPASDIVNVSADKKIDTVTIIDLSGKKVQSAKGNQVNVSNLAKGTYILQVNYGGGAVENTKLIKK